MTQQRNNTLNETTVSFGVSARLVAILGQHLIRDNTVGLMELIKNGYDADADQVTVEMYDLAHPARTTITVQDNGDGMTRDVLTGPWLTVAHGHKEVSKAQDLRSPLGRIPLGEKGVGRFAVHKLGHQLLLVTRPRGQDTELVLEINWDDFEQQQSLDAVGLRLAERPPEVFLGPDAHGTRLEMTGARDKWLRRDVQKLQASLIRLTHPRFGVSNFQITLRCPEYPELADLTTHDILDKYQFRLDCQVDGEGFATYTYRWRDGQLQEHEERETVSLWQERVERNPECGPLSITVCAWLMQPRLLEALGTNRHQVQALAGVSTYRDGFRILPYGDEGDDWLGLDQRRINNPTERFGNRQVAGAVAVDQVNNKALVDKTNREGLQENQAFDDLRKLVLAAVARLEQLAQSQRVRQHKTLVEQQADLSRHVAKLDTVVKSIAAGPVGTSVAVSTPVAARPVPDATPAPAPAAVQVVLDVAQVQELQRLTSQVQESATRIAAVQEEEQDAYLQLIGAGLAAERFVHEMDRQLARALESSATLRGAGLTGVVGEASRQLDLFVNSLRGEMRLLGQLRYVRRSQRAREVSVREIIEFLLLSYDGLISKLAVEVDPWLEDDFTVFMSEAAVAQVIDNILDNALYWLGTVQPPGGRKLRVDLDAVDRTVVISNNGPAIDRVVRDRLFARPFATTKVEGHGLGMYLSGEIMKRAGGAISLVPEDECVLDGPGLVVRFPAGTAGE